MTCNRNLFDEVIGNSQMSDRRFHDKHAAVITQLTTAEVARNSCERTDRLTQMDNNNDVQKSIEDNGSVADVSAGLCCNSEADCVGYNHSIQSHEKGEVIVGLTNGLNVLEAVTVRRRRGCFCLIEEKRTFFDRDGKKCCDRYPLIKVVLVFAAIIIAAYCIHSVFLCTFTPSPSDTHQEPTELQHHHHRPGDVVKSEMERNSANDESEALVENSIGDEIHMNCQHKRKSTLRKLCARRGGSQCMCLRLLHHQQLNVAETVGGKIETFDSRELTRLSPETRRRIVAIPGQHIDRRGILASLPAITDLQRFLSVHGSVGQMGDVGIGKVTALLAQLVNRSSGEDLFVVDPFNETAADAGTASKFPSFNGLSQFEQFTATVGQFDLDVVLTTADRGDNQLKSKPKVYVHHGTSSDWGAIERSLINWNVPQFRLIIMETKGQHNDNCKQGADVDAMALRARFDMAVCLLRDGGLLGLDVSDGLNLEIEKNSESDYPEYSSDVRSSQPRHVGVAESLVAGFLERHGHDVISPLVLIDNTLYLATTKWRRKYAEHLTDWLQYHHVITTLDGSTERLRLATARSFQSHVFYVVR